MKGLRSSITVVVAGTSQDVFPPADMFVPILLDTSSLSPYGIFSALREIDVALESDFIGFCTSAEYFNFAGALSSPSTCEPHLSKASLERYGLFDDRAMTAALRDSDLLVALPIDLRKAKPSFVNVRSRLESIPSLKKQDIELFHTILAKTYPEYARLAVEYCNGSLYGSQSLCIMKRKLFEEYCSLLFGVLDAFHEERDTSGYSLESYVALEHLGHMITALFVLQKERETAPALVIKKLPTVYFEETQTPLFLQSCRKGAIPVVFASNERFAPFLGVCMQSMLEHISPPNWYDIVVLESNLSEDSKRRLELMCSRWDTVSLRFFNPTAMLSGRKLQKNSTDHISMETYYRFLIADILPEYEKVLYLDCDTVILDDVANLFATDLGSAAIGAAIDPEIPGQRELDPSLVAYMRDVLHMDDKDPYLQAGVLVLNLEAMNKLHSVDEWLALAGERKYRYNDQDILNKECKGHLHLLDLSWNTVVDCNGRRLPIIEKGPRMVLQAYLKARCQPKLVHYAGFEKPWDAPGSDFAYLFWDFANRSTFADRVLSMRVGDLVHAKKAKQPFVQRLFPRGTRRRDFAKRVFYWVSRT
ncbi:glycosyltransferase [Sphaerochaeta sp. PS]|uniref:glycosyltransferase n=1 Tax=Sphaerochaeta sp. PS TaxID=3076336 RepID=UPI0028A54E3C|nr:glycosyltransferase [Sphaerochaeta sp. PS]MDT4761984.1 glycosyltransferase [Sphaerochaeta sp. PS]